MTNKRYTDEEIVRALECCLCDNPECLQCQNKELCEIEYDELATKAIDLIVRKMEEIERLKSANNEKFCQWDILAEKTKQHYADLYNEAKDIVKAEAYKEFAERLKLHSYIISNESQTGIINRYSVITVNQIDNLLKEMVGGMNGI